MMIGSTRHPSSLIIAPLPKAGASIRDNEIRELLRSRHPRLPRLTDRRSRTSALRRFCEPFAELLCETVPERRRTGQIPRTILRPLWNLMAAERAGGWLFDHSAALASNCQFGEVDVAALIHRARRDSAFAKAAANRHPDFWEIVDDIRAAFLLADRVRDARDYLRTAAASRNCPHWLLDHLAASVAWLSAMDPKAADLFVMMVVKHRPVTRTALEMLNRLANHPAARRHVAGLLDRLAEDVRTRALAALPEDGPADPVALETVVRDMLALKLTAGKLPQAVAPFGALEADMLMLLADRFLPWVLGLIDRLLPSDRTDLLHPEPTRLRNALGTFMRSRRLFKALSVLDIHQRALDGLTGMAARRLADLSAEAAHMPPAERRIADRTLDDTMQALHLIAPPGRLLAMAGRADRLAGAA